MTTTTTTPNDVRAVQIGDRDALRAHLEGLNEAGIGCSAAGIAGNGQPFLIELSGCYAETETVLWGDPLGRAMSNTQAASDVKNAERRTCTASTRCSSPSTYSPLSVRPATNANKEIGGGSSGQYLSTKTSRISRVNRKQVGGGFARYDT